MPGFWGYTKLPLLALEASYDPKCRILDVNLMLSLMLKLYDLFSPKLGFTGSRKGAASL